GRVGVAAVELRFHQGHDVDAVDPQVLDVAADVHVDQGRATDHGPGQIDQLEAGAREVDVAEPGAGQVDVLEPGAGQVLAGEVGHPASLPGTRSADEPAGERGRHRLAVAPGDGAVHEHQAHPGRVLAGGAVAGAGGEPAGADDADVGGQAGRQPSPVPQPVHVGGVGRQVTGGLLVPGLRPGRQVVRGQAGERRVA